MSNFQEWMDHYSCWLKVMYLEFKHLCSKYDMKNVNQDYHSFCLLLYKHTSEKNKLIFLLNKNV
jgi:hypothetical protein